MCNGSCGIHTSTRILSRKKRQRHHRTFHKGKQTQPSFDERTLLRIQVSVLAHAVSKRINGDSETMEEAYDEEINAENEPVAVNQDWTDPAYPDPVSTSPTACMKAEFKKHMVEGNADVAASSLVAWASWQTPNPTSLPASYENIVLFLYLAKLVLCIGQLQQETLSKCMEIMYPMVEHLKKSWSPIPCSMSGFRSFYINPSNHNSLASILPIPVPTELPDGHGYTSFRSILSHALMMTTFDPKQSKDKKWKSIVACAKFQTFLQGIPPLGDRTNHSTPSQARTALAQLAVGIILWTDGWDPATSTKSNRNNMHTGTITMVFVDVITGKVIGTTTYPNMGGPGKLDHEPVFQKFKNDLVEFESATSDRVFSSQHHGGEVEVHTQLLFILQDQQERRPASGLLGGNSILHTIFGVSCDFKQLDRPFNGCSACKHKLIQYLFEEDWSLCPMHGRCQNCLSWSLHHLSNASYKESYELPGDCVENDMHGEALFHGPGQLTSSLLLAGWNHCIQMYCHQREWMDTHVKKYLKQLCVNDATANGFVEQARRYVLLDEVFNNPIEYDQHEIDATKIHAEQCPEMYELPEPPAMWQLGETGDKTEGIIHISMGIQREAFKFAQKWATKQKKGAALQRRQQTVVKSVQDIKLQDIPCRYYKDEKFGGFTAENYRANTMIAPWSYGCLREDEFQQAPPHQPHGNKPQDSWFRKDNIAWMDMRDIEYDTKLTAKEAKQKVKSLMLQYGHDGPPIAHNNSNRIEAWEMRDLMWRLFNMFRALFCVDLAGSRAKNRATASVMHFLFLMEDLDIRLFPQRKEPIWIAKFNFLGLLRTCESFERFNHVRNLYEGGILGEGMVKQLRPLVSKKVHGKWATNLLLAYYRHSSLDTLIAAVERCRDVSQAKPFCPIRDVMDLTKFKRFGTLADVNSLLYAGKPISVVLYGCRENWKAGVVVVSLNHWYFFELIFQPGNSGPDKYGFTYHKVTADNQSQCLVGDVDVKSLTIGTALYPFWDYGLLLPNFVGAGDPYQPYALVASSWKYLAVDQTWCEFSY